MTLTLDKALNKYNLIKDTVYIFNKQINSIHTTPDLFNMFFSSA